MPEKATRQTPETKPPRILLLHDVEAEAEALASFAAPRIPAEIATNSSLQKSDFDLVLVAWRFRGGAFLEVRHDSGCRFGVYGVDETAEAITACLAAGATACATASCRSEEFVDLIRRATRGAYALSEVAIRLLAECVVGRTSVGVHSRLTPREREAVALLAKGCCNKEIAAALSICLPTVKNHLRSAFAKLDVHSRTEALAMLNAWPSSTDVRPALLVPKD